MASFFSDVAAELVAGGSLVAASVAVVVFVRPLSRGVVKGCCALGQVVAIPFEGWAAIAWRSKLMVQFAVRRFIRIASIFESMLQLQCLQSSILARSFKRRAKRFGIRAARLFRAVVFLLASEKLAWLAMLVLPAILLVSASIVFFVGFRELQLSNIHSLVFILWLLIFIVRIAGSSALVVKFERCVVSIKRWFALRYLAANIWPIGYIRGCVAA